MAPPPPPPLDPLVWEACAGAAGHIPAAGSTVYYFPQGHAEQASSPPNFSSIPHRKPHHRCRITSVSLLANRDTDEVYATILLDPRPPPPAAAAAAAAPPACPGGVASFLKVLTPSDANNGGGFSVPRTGAESIFPRLDYNADLPYQNISVRDVHGTVWGFRHIFRGTPRRHLLTTGWGKFVNSKMLVAGDTVVFIRDQVGELVLGIKRGRRTFGGVSAQNVKGRVPAESVVEAVRLAEMGCPFEVMYYPRSGSPEFVVDAEVVERSTRVQWHVGLMVKMSLEANDGSRMTSGTVSRTVVSDPVLWPASPWRMLQVTLDDKFLNNIRTLNPWQVELASSVFHQPTPHPAFKRLKSSPSSEQANNVEPDIYYPVTGFVGDLPLPLFSYNHFPAGMQGARQNPCDSNLTNLVHKNTDNLYSDSSLVSKGSDKFNDVSTDLSIGVSAGSTSHSDSSSPRSQSNNIEFSGTAGNSGERRSSLKLFGTVIQGDQTDVQATVDFPCILSR